MITRKKESEMILNELLTVLDDKSSATIQLMLPNGSLVPAHFHITEVGRVHKDFIDCGGTIRSFTAWWPATRNIGSMP